MGTTEAAASLETVQKTVRALRHEVGDFLQSVYSAVAILQTRLPAEASLERTVVGNLRSRAEVCRTMLDVVQDFLGSPALSYGSVDLAAVTQQLTQGARRRYPHLEIVASADQPAIVHGDPQRLANLGHLLLTYACDAAQHRVEMRASAGPDGSRWEVFDDASAPSADEVPRLFEPFAVARQGRLSLGLAPAAKLVALHGGEICAAALTPAGLHVHVSLPPEAPLS
jgi:signal transduction histidine kinase